MNTNIEKLTKRVADETAALAQRTAALEDAKREAERIERERTSLLLAAADDPKSEAARKVVELAQASIDAERIAKDLHLIVHETRSRLAKLDDQLAQAKGEALHAQLDELRDERIKAAQAVDESVTQLLEAVRVYSSVVNKAQHVRRALGLPREQHFSGRLEASIFARLADEGFSVSIPHVPSWRRPLASIERDYLGITKRPTRADQERKAREEELARYESDPATIERRRQEHITALKRRWSEHRRIFGAEDSRVRQLEAELVAAGA